MLSFLKNLSFGALNPLSSSDSHVALDIGSSSIKMIEVAAEKNGYRILNLGISPIPENAIQNNMIVDADTVVQAIRRLVQERGVKSKQVISAVPGRAVIMKKIQMPKQGPAELEANIEFEAQNIIPESLANVNLDYQVVHESEDGNKMDVMLVAVKKEIINSYTDVIEAAGLAPTVMDVDYFALENMYETNYGAGEKGVVALIHVGAQYTSITLLQDGLAIFTGDLSLGGAYFTDNLARQLGVDAEAAEAIKTSGTSESGADAGGVEPAIRSTSEELVEEIQRTVSLYGAVPSEDGEGLRAVYLSGGGAKLSGLRALLEERMRVPAKLSEPFRAFQVHRSIDRDYLSETAPYYAVGAGLSIRRPDDR